MTEKEKNYLNQWRSKAREDYLTINRLTEGEVIATSSVCFHCQQLVEKYLKMFLVYHRQEIVKTHEIEFLLHECSKIDSDFENIDPVNLSDFGVALRYPDDYYLPSVDEALFYKGLALKFKKLVEDKIDF